MLKLQQDIRKYLKKRNWDTQAPADIAKSISIEASELLEHFQWNNDGKEVIQKDKERFFKMQSEVADIFIYIAGFAISTGFDLEKAIYAKLEKVEKKYPANIVNVTKEGMKKYLKIKEEHRKK